MSQKARRRPSWKKGEAQRAAAARQIIRGLQQALDLVTKGLGPLEAVEIGTPERPMTLFRYRGTSDG